MVSLTTRPEEKAFGVSARSELQNSSPGEPPRTRRPRRGWESASSSSPLKPHATSRTDPAEVVPSSFGRPGAKEIDLSHIPGSIAPRIASSVRGNEAREMAIVA